MKKNILKRTIGAVSAAVLAVTVAVPSFDGGIKASAAMDMSEFSSGYSYPTKMRGLTAFQLVSDMGPGWNLGNSLESADNETKWGNPETTKAMIDKIAAKGFTTLRVPVRWDDHYSNPSKYTIDSSYMDRVETVVNYGLANGMYVILNIHHNDIQQKVTTDTSVQAAVKAELAEVWRQVGTRFKNYGDKLIFETINEPRCGDDWVGNSAYYSCVNDYNEAARSAIRATGGNNADRLVMMPTYCASADEAKINGWTKSSSDSMIAVSIHAYLPFDFAFQGDGHSDWLTSDEAELQSVFDRLNSRFISKGIPVVMGEFGACNKDNTSYRKIYADYYAGLARQFAQQDIPCVWWDNNCFGTGAENFGIFNRNSCSFTYSEIADALISAYKGDPECETAAPAEIVLASGSMTSSNWGQAVTLEAGTILSMSADQAICAAYSSANPPELILMSFSNSNKGWVKIAPTSASGGIAKWTYADILSVYKDSFADLGKVYIGDTGADLTVTKVYINNPNAHKHNYSGATKVTLQPTATTKGRKTVACSVSGCSAYKIEVLPTSSASDTIAAPTITSASGSTSGAVIKWNAVDGATNYRVYRADSASGTKTLLKTVASTSYTDTTAASGRTYYYFVQAYNSSTSVFSDYSAGKAVTIPASESLKAPQATVTAGVDRVVLRWNEISGATAYRVFYRVKGTTAWSYKSTTKTAMNLTGLKGGKTYEFVVRAYNGSEWSKYSSANILTATPKAGIAKPVVTSVTAADSSAIIRWNAVSGAVSYRVFYRIKGTTAWSFKNTTKVAMNLTGLKNGTTYEISVLAYNGSTWSVYNAADNKSVTPVAGLAKPVVTSVAPTNGGAVLRWNAVSGAKLYRVYYRVKGTTAWSIRNTTLTSVSLTGLKNGTVYEIAVRAYDGSRWSAYSTADVKTVTPAA